MDELSVLVYRGYGQHQRKGGGFSFEHAETQKELDGLLGAGWFATLPEAIEAHDNPKKEEEKPAAVDNKSAPTRAEMELKANELGIKFDGRTKDAKLLILINEKLG